MSDTDANSYIVPAHDSRRREAEGDHPKYGETPRGQCLASQYRVREARCIGEIERISTL